MSYQVLARKWRPRNFEQMVGQPHVLKALVNALEEGRVHHAYLFTGTRGVGKTTVARIFAKCLNCESGVTAHPCDQCSACREIDEGRFVDLIEVDAASRTKVEDTRELLDNVQYAPTRGRYKVYLIDEVHMLSGHSFNALLKTLEEPPPHVKFLLATTDPQKLPVTILSRCLQFNLKRMPAPMIAGHLSHILENEAITGDETALMELATAADGSMRDALSLLDQAIAFGGGQVRQGAVRDMLGGVSRESVLEIVEALVAGEGTVLIEAVRRLAEQAPDFEAVLGDLISTLHQIALAQVVPEALDEGLVARDRLLGLTTQLAPEDLQLYYQIALHGRRDLPLAPDPGEGFEMLLLRMLAFRPAQAGQTRVPVVSGHRPLGAEASAQTRNAGSQRPATPTQQDSLQERPPQAEPDTCAPVSVEASPEAATPEPSAPIAAPAQDWAEILQALGLRAMAHTLASNCTLIEVDEATIRLALARQHEDLCTRNAEQRLQEALQAYYGRPLKLKIEITQPQTETPAQAVQRGEQERQQEAQSAIETDHVAQALKDAFGAELVPGSVKPL